MATKAEVLAQITRLRAQLDELTAQIADTPALVNTIPDGIRPWKPGTMETPITYTANVDIRIHGGIPYRCAQTHTHHGEADWEPGAAPSLWVQYHGTSAETARAYVAPTGGHDVYRLGEYMTYGGKLWTPAVDNMAYSPEQYAAGWTEVPQTA